MLSRIADSLFWTNRYMERADGMLRCTMTNYILMFDKGVSNNLSWQHILEVFTNCEEEEIEALKYNTEGALYKLLLDSNNTDSLKVVLGKARENARGIQDNITKEVWEQVNGMYHAINAPQLEDKLKGYDALETADLFCKESIMYNGVTDTTMPRGLGWSFMNLGRYIERCFITLEVVDKFFSLIDYNIEEEKDILQWRPMLLALSGYELHLKTYRSSSHNENALHQVVFNKDFTRSVLYSLLRISKYLVDVLQENNTEHKDAIIRRFGRLLSQVEYMDFSTLNKDNLQDFFAELKTSLADFSNLIGLSFFSYS
ncbi:alpha-E domain-containing protein [Parasediminibacterium sp. JCM 36343]|uniref:alpha-E domain-containing protein n=1 Tax=Parasediminibacterium sp. JCM 36343 TaxID=3374279 RepID=UPI00397829B2